MRAVVEGIISRIHEADQDGADHDVSHLHAVL